MTRKFFLLVLFLLSVGCARTSTLPTRAPTSLEPGDKRDVMSFAGRERTYIVHLPPAVRNPGSFALVLVLHGGGGAAEGAAKMTGMSALADRAGFIVAYPNGTGRLDDRLLTWNSGNCCSYALDNNVDDVGFIRALIEKLLTTLPVDPKRVYATGISNGGMMSYRLACELSDKIAAIAPVAGALNVACNPAQRVSVIAFHGTADENVPYDGGTGTKSVDPHPRVDKSVSYAMSFWAQRNGCAATPKREERGNILRDEYTGCIEGTRVVLYTVKGGGHAWPGGERMALFLDAPTKEISASELISDFFAQHSK